MLQLDDITNHYKENFPRLVKKMWFRAGTLQAGEDIIQIAYERAIRYRKSCDPERFPQWFNTLMNNALRDYKNAEKGYVQVDEEFLEEGDSVDCMSYPSHILREIHEMINGKIQDHQQILNLHFREGYSAIDISRMTNHSYAKCHQVIQRFRNDLKEIYKE